MVFTSYLFLFLFLPAFLIFYFLCPPRHRNLTIVMFSYCFYGMWRLDFCLLLAALTVINYYLGLVLSKNRDKRKAILVGAICLNLGILLYFKYFNFAVDSINELGTLFKFERINIEKIVLPIAISFITFESISYLVDIYRGVMPATRKFIDFATYMSLFPRLIAGPIVRFTDVAESLVMRPSPSRLFASGFFLFMLGFNKKVLIANNLAPFANNVFDFAGYGFLMSWIGTIAYTFQLYFDFSGYSDMAIGLAFILGFNLPVNFNSPYKSASFSEFWKRWHITLSSWIRDYLYIPLGGSRANTMRIKINLLTAMTLSGLWHGANWTFIFWGFYHGFILISEKQLSKLKFVKSVPRGLKVFITFIFIIIGWVVFRSETFSDAYTILGAMAGTGYNGVGEFQSYLRLNSYVEIIILIAAIVVFFFPNSQEIITRKNRTWLIVTSLLFLFAMTELFNQSYNPFLYFQF